MNDELCLGLRVERRLGIGHAGDRRDAAGDGRRGPGGDGLVLLPTGLAEVDVHVDPAGGNDQVRRVDGAIGCSAGLLADAEDAIVFDPQIGDMSRFWDGSMTPAVGDAKGGHGDILVKENNHRAPRTQR